MRFKHRNATGFGVFDIYGSPRPSAVRGRCPGEVGLQLCREVEPEALKLTDCDGFLRVGLEAWQLLYDEIASKIWAEISFLVFIF